MHGQSEYTESKQHQLRELLFACGKAWKNVNWAHPTRLFLDCMAGSGYTDDKKPGSPLIMQDFARTMDASLCVWCDKESDFTDKLAQYRGATTHILNGRYQDEMKGWLEKYSSIHPEKLMGVIYLDDNGCKQIWDDDGFLEWVMRRFPYLDVAVHFSETAWRRSNGVGFDWAARTSVVDVLKRILSYKPASVIYSPKNKHLWRLVYGVRSAKMNLTGSNRIKLKDYIQEIESEQQPLLFS